MTFIFGTLFVCAMLAVFIGGIMILIAAFRQSVLWGLGTLIVPFVGLIFVILHWQEAKRGFLLTLGGYAVLFLSIFVIGGMSSTMTPDEQVVTFPDDSPLSDQFEAPPPRAREPEVAEPVEVDDEPVDFEEIMEEVEAVSDEEAAAEPIEAQSRLERRPYVAQAAPARPTVLSPDRWGELVGRRIDVVQRSGQLVQGVTLLAVHSDRLTLRRKLGGGTMDFDLPRRKIEEIRPAR
ncbi:MAG: hypothetical protein AAF604_10355 [Acidobacteriota bacterium]